MWWWCGQAERKNVERPEFHTKNKTGCLLSLLAPSQLLLLWLCPIPGIILIMMMMISFFRAARVDSSSVCVEETTLIVFITSPITTIAADIVKSYPQSHLTHLPSCFAGNFSPDAFLMSEGVLDHWWTFSEHRIILQKVQSISIISQLWISVFIFHRVP